MAKINKKFEDILNNRQYKANYKVPQEQVLFTIQDKVIGTAGNFIAFTGLPKAVKSTFLNAALSSAYLYHPIFGLKINPPPGRQIIGYFDTESNEFDFYCAMDRIKNFSSSAIDNNLHAYMFRDLMPSDIMQSIEYYLSVMPQCSIVVIDGLLDLLLDYNDIAESRLLINYLKRITQQFNILVIGVVHIGKKTGETLGHFGSMVDRYSQSVLSVEKDREKNIYSLKPKLLRSSSDFNNINLTNQNGTFIQTF